MATSQAQAFNFEDSQALVQKDVELIAAIEKVAKLDFSMLNRKFIEEYGWTTEFCLEVEDLYRKFLALNMRYADKKICPTGPVDEYWHAHILDTHAYVRDCDTLFGKFLHHFPYFGMRGPEDRTNLEAAFEESLDLFVMHFGVDPTAGDIKARSCSPQRCP